MMRNGGVWGGVSVATQVKQQKPAVSSTILLIAAVIILAAAGIWFFLMRAPSNQGQTGTLTPEAKAYVAHLGLSDVEMKAAESYMGSRLVEITGKIANKGERVLRLVEINCVFYDPYGNLVLRERVPIVRQSGQGLKPGEVRTFRLPFDSIPSTWNQALPQLVIARIDFAN